jgi:hypothetical protein
MPLGQALPAVHRRVLDMVKKALWVRLVRREYTHDDTLLLNFDLCEDTANGVDDSLRGSRPFANPSIQPHDPGPKFPEYRSYLRLCISRMLIDQRHNVLPPSMSSTRNFNEILKNVLDL